MLQSHVLAQTLHLHLEMDWYKGLEKVVLDRLKTASGCIILQKLKFHGDEVLPGGDKKPGPFNVLLVLLGLLQVGEVKVVENFKLIAIRPIPRQHQGRFQSKITRDTDHLRIGTKTDKLQAHQQLLLIQSTGQKPLR